jgi:hypothetical protein
MRALEFWKAVVVDESNFLASLVTLLAREGARYCVIGGQAVNAYVEPLVSLDLDLAVAAEDLPKLEDALRASFRVQRFAHSLNLSLAGSDLRAQVQTDPRYAAFVSRAQTKEVLGLALPVAAVDDVLRGKVWAALDPERRPSKRQKDLADIARLLERYPDLRPQVPREILDRLL